MNRSHRFRISHLLYVLGFVFLIATEGAGQTLTIGGGNQTLTITTGIAGGQLLDNINTNATLTYGTGNRLRKITVRTLCPGQSFNLSVVATNVTRGVAAPAVTLITGSPAINFITDIPRRTNGTCRLQYTASATFAQGNRTEVGDDVHTVTYTIQTQ